MYFKLVYGPILILLMLSNAAWAQIEPQDEADAPIIEDTPIAGPVAPTTEPKTQPIATRDTDTAPAATSAAPVGLINDTQTVTLKTIKRKLNPKGRKPGKQTVTALKAGPHLGIGARLVTNGQLRVVEHSSDEYNSSSDTTYYSMGTFPGFTMFFEYISSGRIVAPGIAFRMQFPTIETWDYYSSKVAVGVEMQLDYQMRFYLSKSALFRPYLQGSVGLTIGVSNEVLKDSWPIAAGLNGGGAAGVALTPRNSKAAFYFDVGLEGTHFWAPEHTTTVMSGWDGTQYERTSNPGDGGYRALIMSIGIII